MGGMEKLSTMMTLRSGAMQKYHPSMFISDPSAVVDGSGHAKVTNNSLAECLRP